MQKLGTIALGKWCTNNHLSQEILTLLSECLWIEYKIIFSGLGKTYKNVFHDYAFFLVSAVILRVTHSCGKLLLELGACFLCYPKYMSVITCKGGEIPAVSETTFVLRHQGV